MSDLSGLPEGVGAASSSAQTRKRGSRKSIAFQPTSSSEGPSSFSRDDNKENGGGKSRKLRSKSLMPGELEPIGRGKRASLLFGGESTIAPRSILKPAIPLSPLQQIPAHQSSNKQSSAPAPIMAPLKTEEEQQQEREQREAERTIAMNHRAARRKSLGGRRVSFHPEVTLHVLEEVRTPPTHGTEKKKSTRRSSMRPKPEATPTPAAAPEPALDDPPSTPPKQIEEEAPSPENAREEHRKVNRRSSLGTPKNNEDTEDLMQLSPTPSSVYSSPGVPDDDSVLAPDNSDDEDDTGIVAASPSVTMHSDLSDDDDDDGLGRGSSPSPGDEEIEITGAFKPWIVKPHNHPRLSHPETGFTSAPASERSPPKSIQPWTGKSHDHPRLSHPETGFASGPPRPVELLQNIQDQDGDMTMDITRVVGPGLIQSPTPTPNPDEDDDNAMEVTRVIGRGILGARGRESIAPRQAAPAIASENDEDEEMTMEITRVIGPGLLSQGSPQARPKVESDDDEGEQTMEITRVVGPGLLSQGRPAASRRSSAISRRLSAATNATTDDDDEQTMEITRAIGGIEGWRDDQDQDLGDEDMSMELTKVVGGFLNRSASGNQTNENETENPSSDDSETMEIDMEMTRAIGGIISDSPAKRTPRSRPSTITERTEGSTFFSEADLNGVTMNVTGGLPTLPSKRNTSSPVGRDLPSASKFQRSSPTKAPTNTSPIRRTSARLSRPRASTTPKKETPQKMNTPRKETPQKANTPTSAPRSIPKPAAAQTPPQTTPRKTKETPTRSIGFLTPQKADNSENPESTLPGFGHGLSAKRRIAGNSSAKSTPQRPKTVENALSPTPHRAATGVGISRPGLGSPAISNMLKSRKSLGEDTVSAEAFSPGVKSFSEMLTEIREDKKDTERFLEEERKLQEDAEKATSLREKINRMTPKKSQTQQQQRKSASPDLAGSKRTFGEVRENLQAAAISEPAEAVAASPARKKRRSLSGAEAVCPETREEPVLAKATGVKFAESPAKKTAAASRSNDQDSEYDEEDSEMDEPARIISVKEFLGMIHISFQDDLINITKLRRQTGAFNPLVHGRRRSSLGEEEDFSMFQKMVAKSITSPNLFMYQHACHELKKDISGGRALAKRIEKEAQKNNPQLFHEYDTAPADVRATMDRQFGDIKQYSRLIARRAWYQWRFSVTSDLLQQVEKSHLSPLKADEQQLKLQREIVEKALPTLEEKHKALTEKAVVLRKRNEDVTSADPNELAEARTKLAKTLKTIEEKKRELQKATQKSKDLDETILQRETRKATLQSEIEDAEKVKEANRGFSVQEVMDYKKRVETLENKHNWSIIKMVGPEKLQMRYDSEIDVTFHAIDPRKSKSISYAKENPSIQTSYFFDRLAEEFNKLKFREPRELLSFVKNKWVHARAVIEQFRKIELHYQTQFTVREEDNKLMAKVTLIIPNRKAKIFAYIAVDGVSGNSTDIETEVVYGEKMKGWKLDDYLKQLTADGSTTWKEALQQLVRELNAVQN